MKDNRGTHHRTANNLFARSNCRAFHLRSARTRDEFHVQRDVHESFSHLPALRLIQVRFHALRRLTPSQR
jgi:hypothetical protein